MTQSTSAPSTLGYARPAGVPPRVPGHWLFLLLTCVGVAAVFAPLHMQRSPWNHVTEILWGPRRSLIDTLGGLAFFLSLFLAWPLALVKLRLLYPKPWSLGAYVFAWAAAALACLQAFPVLLNLLFFHPPRTLLDALSSLSTLLATSATAGGLMLAWRLGRKHGPSFGLHSWLLASYTSSIIFVALPFLPFLIRNPEGWRDMGLGLLLYAILALSNIAELILWTRTVLQRSPTPHP